MPRGNNTTKNTKGASGAGTIRKKTVKRNGKEYTYWEARYTTGFDPGTGKQIQKSVTDKTHIKPPLGAIRLDTLSAPTVQHFYNESGKGHGDKKGLAPKTLKGLHGVLHKAMQQAVENQYIRYNPVTACKPPRSVKTEIQPMTEEQRAAFVSEIRGHQHEYLYLIALFTGIRESEVLGLTWDCVDFKHGTLTVKQQLKKASKKSGELGLAPTKNGKTRTIALAPTVLQYFRLQRLRQNSMRLEAGDLWTEKSWCSRTRRAITSPIAACMTVSSASSGTDVYGHVFTQMRVRSAEHTEAHIQKLLAASQ